MEKYKRILIAFALIFTIIFFCVVGLTIYSIFDKPATESKGLRWLRNQSFFMDYSISDDIVSFRYSICFENTSDHDYLISPIAAKFEKSELDGWLRYEKFFEGRVETGEYNTLIPSGETINVIFVFKGDYLGGKVNEKLSHPVDLLFIQEFTNEG